MSDPQIIQPNGGRHIAAKAELIIYSNGQVEFSKKIDNPNVAWGATLSNIAIQLDEQRLAQMAAAINQLMEHINPRPMLPANLPASLKNILKS